MDQSAVLKDTSRHALSRRQRRMDARVLRYLISCEVVLLVAAGEWELGSWGDCVNSGAIFDEFGNAVPPRCTGGLQLRSVECRSAPCDDPEPPKTRFCVLGELCGWSISGWSACSAVQCGQQGEQRRTVTCTSTMVGACPPLKAADQVKTKPCVGTLGCDWYKGSWSACSSSCGVGQQERHVECLKSDGCGGQAPVKVQSCIGDNCVWQVGEWSPCAGPCAARTQQREIRCPYANLCKAEPPPITRTCDEACETPTPDSGSGTPDNTEGDGDTTGGSGDGGSGGDNSNTGGGTGEQVIPYRWFVGEWSACSNQCGPGFMEREVLCTRTCSVYRCPVAPVLKCLAVELRPLSEQNCLGSYANWVNMPENPDGPCLMENTAVEGSIGLDVSEPKRFVDDEAVLNALRKLILDLGVSERLIASMVRITVLQGSGGGRRLDDATKIGLRGRRLVTSGSVIVDFMLVLPRGFEKTEFARVRTAFDGRSLASVRPLVIDALSAEAALSSYIVKVNAFSVVSDPDAAFPSPAPGGNTPATVATPAPTLAPTANGAKDSYECVSGAAALAGGCLRKDGVERPGCNIGCMCCKEKEEEAGPAPSPAPPTAAGNGPPVLVRNPSDTSAANSGGFWEDTWIYLVSSGSVLLFCLGGGGVYAAARAFGIWPLKGRAADSEKLVEGRRVSRQPSDKKKAVSKRSKTVPAEWLREEDEPEFEEPLRNAATAPNLRQQKKEREREADKDKDRDRDRDKERDGRRRPARRGSKGDQSRNADEYVGEDSRDQRSTSDWRGGDDDVGQPSASPTGSAPGASRPPNTPSSKSRKDGSKDMYAGMAKDYRERKAAAKNRPRRASSEEDNDREPPTTPKAQQRSEEQSGPSGPSATGGGEKRTTTPPRGTATPPRSTDNPGSQNFRRSTSGKDDQNGSGSGAAGGRAADDASGEAGRPPPSPGGASSPKVDAPENPALSAAAEHVAQLNAELDSTRSKDAEWRKKHFKSLQLKWHPDKNHDQAEIAAEVFKALMKRQTGYLD
eukprot:TRINITY_DN24898_c0_g1_i1.p1 TRINITY_DN24898_c0_g1~~TRINITY_DN24898_c0_g1_i1.p1  ORF type:complete len:1021 (+),score=129.72 TRINITY_DN24898_c0_g1_i1:125-3187(+)